MLSRLIQDIRQRPIVQEILASVPQDGCLTVRHAYGSLPHLLTAIAARDLERPLFLIAPDFDGYSKAVDDVTELSGGMGFDVLTFPDEEKLPFDQREVAPSIQSARQECFEKIAHLKCGVVVTSARALVQKLPNPAWFQSSALSLNPGASVPIDHLVNRLTSLGYEREDVVDRVGSFAVRGGLVDVYLYSHDQPVRIEFFGDEIESIRIFDVVTQRSLRRVDAVTLYPRSEFRGQAENSLLDYLPNGTIALLEPALIRSQVEQFWNHAMEMAAKSGMPSSEIDAVLKNFYTSEEVGVWLSRNRRIEFSNLSRPSGELVFDLHTRESELMDGHVKRLRERLSDHRQRGWTTTILCNNQAQVDRLDELLDSEQMVSGVDYRIGNGELHAGFYWEREGLVVYTDHQIFGRTKRYRIHRRFRSAQALRYLKSLKPGDYVVHIDYGIGQYAGLEKMIQGEHTEECLKILYQNGDKLFVPLEHFSRVQKFSGEEAVEPKLGKLGSADWERLKAKTRRSIEDIARDLIKLYAQRRMAKGHAFSADGMMQYELEGAFEFEDTPDQAKVTAEVKQDMEAEEPMDRLVCGDVGYGKTEVAVRAAFKAVQDSKQVAILVPTTILAEQHFETFSARLRDFPVRVDVLSRFKTSAQQKMILEKLATGQIDIIIGTHRLLSKDVQFKDLGLLIIDEEQRFGVTHKEKLRQLRAHVDTLTLTATPIPRTLHFSLMGGRDLSTINTPPQDRLPIRTELVQFDEDLIHDAIMKEIDRGGQVYFVHNRVQTIENITSLLGRIVPRARLAIIHGQMPPQRVEKVIHDFMNRQYDVLVATTIIENGIDIPNVNTILIDQAQNYGVSQLYQLRGRVGRSSKQAYCYLITPPLNILSLESLKRLQAIEEFTELGSGFLIAMRDLEIRGAGNLLGAEQSGFINAIGFDLYCQILEQAVQDIRRELNVEKTPVVEPEKILDTQIRVAEDTYLPESYINVGTERIRIYQELSAMRSIDAVDGLRSEVIDRFGPLPIEAHNLFNMVTLKIMASFYGIAKFSVQPEKLVLGFDEALVTRRDLADVFQAKVGAIMNATKNVRLHQAKKELEVWVGYPGYDLQRQRWSGQEPGDRLQWAIEFMKTVQSSELLQLA